MTTASLTTRVSEIAALVADRPRSIRPALPVPRFPVDFWHAPAVIAENNFVYKSLSNWAFNVAVGCSHACRFCYVPSAATIKQGAKLSEYGVKDPDAEWGDYVLLRPWDEQKFLASLRSAENTPRNQLKPDGNRAVIYCSTTDPYQVIRHPDPARQRELAEHARFLVRRSLELIRDQSTVNVRILTRSPLARADFELFRSFGKRLVFGMSLPTLRNDLAKVYEPKAPAPSQRLAALCAAKEAGLHVYVALAPTYPECDEADLRATLKAVAELEPITVFHEPINIRAENVARIKAQAASLDVPLRTEVFATRESWQAYAVKALHSVAELAKEFGIEKHLHLWPDKSLGSQSLANRMQNPDKYLRRLEHWWHRVSEWPK
jgi:DNA repair photolyase